MYNLSPRKVFSALKIAFLGFVASNSTVFIYMRKFILGPFGLVLKMHNIILIIFFRAGLLFECRSGTFSHDYTFQCFRTRKNTSNITL